MSQDGFCALKKDGQIHYYDARYGGYLSSLTEGPQAMIDSLNWQWREIENHPFDYGYWGGAVIDVDAHHLLYWADTLFWDNDWVRISAVHSYEKLLAERWAGWTVQRAFCPLLEFSEYLGVRTKELDDMLQKEYKPLPYEKLVDVQEYCWNQYLNGESGWNGPDCMRDVEPDTDRLRALVDRMNPEQTLWVSVRWPDGRVSDDVLEPAWRDLGGFSLRAGPALFDYLTTKPQIPLEERDLCEDDIDTCIYLDMLTQQAYWWTYPGYWDLVMHWTVEIWPGWTFIVQRDGPQGQLRMTGRDETLLACEEESEE